MEEYEEFIHIAALFDADDFHLLDYIGQISTESDLQYWDSFSVSVQEDTETSGLQTVKFKLFCDAEFPKLEIPGLDAFSIEWSVPGEEPLLAVARFGEDVEIDLANTKITIGFPPEILALATDRNVGTQISQEVTVSFSKDGIVFTGGDAVNVPQSYLFGTDLKISIDALRVSTTGGEFFKADSAEVTLPEGWIAGGDGTPISIRSKSLILSHRGISGRFSLEDGADVTGKIFGFAFKLGAVDLQLVENNLARASLFTKIQIMPPGLQELWVSAEVIVGAHGVSVAFSNDPGEFLRSLTINGIFDFDISGINLIDTTLSGALPSWAFSLCGSITPLFSSFDWPALSVSGIGVSADRGLFIPEGSSIKLDEPYSMEWYVGRLLISELTIGSPEGKPDDIELTLAASVALVEGVPAGASVRGLVATWHRSSGNVDVRLDGVGIQYALPGGFAADFTVAYDSKSSKFLGQGTLDLESLDIRLDIIVEVGREGDTTYLFVVAECDAFPGGIPIGATGLCLYGISGMLAVNKELATKDASDDRFYELFKADPGVGLTHPPKWRPAAGSGAIGLGAVIGTADDGTIFHAKGMFMLTLPELNVFMQAKANVLSKREGMLSEGEGPLSALMSYFPDKQVINFDIDAKWTEEPVFAVAGSAHAHFDFLDPSQFWLALGREPAEEQISAKLFKMGDWFFTGGFWQRIDRKGVATGASATFGKRISIGSFWAEAHAAMTAKMGVYWYPTQIETGSSVKGYAGLGIAGLSLSTGLDVGVELTMPAPQKFLLHAKACITFGFIKTWTICLAHTFGGQNPVAPTLEEPLLQVLAEPRLWTPPAERLADGSIDDGITPLRSGNVVEVWPHSSIVLDFAKSMQTKQIFSGHAEIPSQRVGTQSGYTASYKLRDITLTCLDDPALSPIIFGTWSISPATRLAGNPSGTVEPKPPNSSLQLLSSDRFGRRGSISGAGAEQIGIDYCKFQPTIPMARHCISLASMTIGKGTLKNGWPYEWIIETYPGELWRSNLWGVVYPPLDRITIRVPADASDFSIRFAPFYGREPGATQEQAAQLDGRTIFLPRWHTHTIVTELCYNAPRVADTDNLGEITHLGSAGTEEWNIDPGSNLFRPHHTYVLSFTTERLINEALQSSTHHEYQFKAKAAPEYQNALRSAIHAVRPSQGTSPFFYGYDIAIEFKENFVPHIYRASDRPLALRFQKNDGTFVTADNGSPLWRDWLKGKLNLDKIEKWWRDTYLINQGENCIETEVKHDSFETTMSPVDIGAKLEPATHYRAQVVAARDNTDSAIMFEWSFLTSQFATFSEMMRTISVGPPTYLGSLPTEQDFASIARACRRPAVYHPTEATATPILSGPRLAAILLETSEPMSDLSGRLSIDIGDVGAVEHRTNLVANADFTRIFIVPAAPEKWPTGLEIAYKLNWKRKPGEDMGFWRSKNGNLDDEDLSAIWDFTQWAG